MKFTDPAARLGECVEIWNSYVKAGETVFKPTDAERFKAAFLAEKEYTQISCAVEDEGRLAAYGFANTVQGSPTAYITYIGVNRDKARRGFGTAVLSELEKKLRAANPALQKIELVFYNPCLIPWHIPNAAPHDHPGAPGVDMKSAAYPFFAKNGYADYAIQNAYYLPLSKYEYPAEIAAGKEKLAAEGIRIGYYDPATNYGFPELFDNIKNEGWRREVLSQLDKDIVVASDGGRVVGYTGPLTVSPEGRGVFCGIGVRTEYRKRGIGKLLFASLCRGFSEKGAQYMSLFTGDNNPARNIYEGAGFKIVRSFADMRKPLQ